MAEPTTLIGGLGVDWCPIHSGVRNEDQNRCDMAEDDEEFGDDGEPRPCHLYELLYDPNSPHRVEPPAGENGSSEVAS